MPPEAVAATSGERSRSNRVTSGSPRHETNGQQRQRSQEHLEEASSRQREASSAGATAKLQSSAEIGHRRRDSSRSSNNDRDAACSSGRGSQRLSSSHRYHRGSPPYSGDCRSPYSSNQPEVPEEHQRNNGGSRRYNEVPRRQIASHSTSLEQDVSIISRHASQNGGFSKFPRQGRSSSSNSSEHGSPSRRRGARNPFLANRGSEHDTSSGGLVRPNRATSPPPGGNWWEQTALLGSSKKRHRNFGGWRPHGRGQDIRSSSALSTRNVPYPESVPEFGEPAGVQSLDSLGAGAPTGNTETRGAPDPPSCLVNNFRDTSNRCPEGAGGDPRHQSAALNPPGSGLAPSQTPYPNTQMPQGQSVVPPLQLRLRPMLGPRSFGGPVPSGSEANLPSNAGAMPWQVLQQQQQQQHQQPQFGGPGVALGATVGMNPAMVSERMGLFRNGGPPPGMMGMRSRPRWPLQGRNVGAGTTPPLRSHEMCTLPPGSQTSPPMGFIPPPTSRGSPPHVTTGAVLRMTSNDSNLAQSAAPGLPPSNHGGPAGKGPPMKLSDNGLSAPVSAPPPPPPPEPDLTGGQDSRSHGHEFVESPTKGPPETPAGPSMSSNSASDPRDRDMDPGAVAPPGHCWYGGASHGPMSYGLAGQQSSLEPPGARGAGGAGLPPGMVPGPPPGRLGGLFFAGGHRPQIFGAPPGGHLMGRPQQQHQQLMHPYGCPFLGGPNMATMMFPPAGSGATGPVGLMGRPHISQHGPSAQQAHLPHFMRRPHLPTGGGPPEPLNSPPGFPGFIGAPVFVPNQHERAQGMIPLRNPTATGGYNTVMTAEGDTGNHYADDVSAQGEVVPPPFSMLPGGPAAAVAPEIIFSLREAQDLDAVSELHKFLSSEVSREARVHGYFCSPMEKTEKALLSKDTIEKLTAAAPPEAPKSCRLYPQEDFWQFIEVGFLKRLSSPCSFIDNNPSGSNLRKSSPSPQSINARGSMGAHDTSRPAEGLATGSLESSSDANPAPDPDGTRCNNETAEPLNTTNDTDTVACCEVPHSDSIESDASPRAKVSRRRSRESSPIHSFADKEDTSTGINGATIDDGRTELVASNIPTVTPSPTSSPPTRLEQHIPSGLSLDQQPAADDETTSPVDSSKSALDLVGISDTTIPLASDLVDENFGNNSKDQITTHNVADHYSDCSSCNGVCAGSCLYCCARSQNKTCDPGTEVQIPAESGYKNQTGGEQTGGGDMNSNGGGVAVGTKALMDSYCILTSAQKARSFARWSAVRLTAASLKTDYSSFSLFAAAALATGLTRNSDEPSSMGDDDDDNDADSWDVNELEGSSPHWRISVPCRGNLFTTSRVAPVYESCSFEDGTDRAGRAARQPLALQVRPRANRVVNFSDPNAPLMLHDRMVQQAVDRFVACQRYDAILAGLLTWCTSQPPDPLFVSSLYPYESCDILGFSSAAWARTSSESADSPRCETVIEQEESLAPAR